MYKIIEIVHVVKLNDSMLVIYTLYLFVIGNFVYVYVQIFMGCLQRSQHMKYTESLRNSVSYINERIN